MSLPGLLFHGTMLSDRARNDALAAGIAAVVRPGDVVVDVGAGSGLMSMLAARAGARRVHALEEGAMAAVAEDLVRRNAWDHVVSVQRVRSHDWEPPERADVVLCETLGYAVLEEGFRRTIADARERMLAPHGRLLPRSVEILAVPISTRGLPIDADYIGTVLDLDLAPLADGYRGLHQRLAVPLEDEAGPRRRLLELDCASLSPHAALTAQASFPVAPGREVTAFALWFEATLADGVVLSSRAPDPSNHWAQTVLPLREPLRTARAGEIGLDVELDDRLGLRIEWEASVREVRDRAAA